MVCSRSIGKFGPFEPSLDAHLCPRARSRAATTTTSLWKRNGIGQKVSTMQDGNNAVGGGSVVDLDVSGVSDDSVEWYAGTGIDDCVFQVCRAEEVGSRWEKVNECEIGVHLAKRRGNEREGEKRARR